MRWPAQRFKAYIRLLQENGINPYAWPSKSRLHWHRENGEISWPADKADRLAGILEPVGDW